MLFFKSTVGLYIGPKTVQLAHLQRVGKKVQLVNFIHVDIFEHEQTGTTDKDERIISALRKAITKSKIDIKRINTVLMPGMVLLRYFKMPKISAEELEEAVRFEARKYIPFRLEEAVTGFYILKDDQETKKLGILSLVTKEESIKNHLTLLHRVNIHPMAVETASFALLRLLEYSGEIDKEKSNVVLYFYSQRLNIVILKNGIPYFVRDISLARKEEWIDDETAEFLAGEKIVPPDSRQLALENAVSELRISLEYYQKEIEKEPVSKIILCGEIEDFDDLDTVLEVSKDEPDNEYPLAVYLHKNFKIPVNTIDPLKNILSPKAKPLPYTFPMLAVTIGAGLKNLVKSTVEIDLFRTRKRTSLRAKIFIGKMLIAGAIGLILSYLLIYLGFYAVVSREKNLLEQEKLNRPKFMDLSHFSDEQLVAGKKEIDRRMEIYDKFVKNRVVMTEKLNIIPKVIPVKVWLNSVSISVAYDPDPRRLKKITNCTIAGFIYAEQKGVEVDVINKFSEDLKTNDAFFKDFKVIKTGSVTRGEFFKVSVMHFELNCLSESLELQEKF